MKVMSPKTVQVKRNRVTRCNKHWSVEENGLLLFLRNDLNYTYKKIAGILGRTPGSATEKHRYFSGKLGRCDEKCEGCCYSMGDQNCREAKSSMHYRRRYKVLWDAPENTSLQDVLNLYALFIKDK